MVTLSQAPLGRPKALDRLSLERRTSGSARPVRYRFYVQRYKELPPWPQALELQDYTKVRARRRRRALRLNPGPGSADNRSAGRLPASLRTDGRAA